MGLRNRNDTSYKKGNIPWIKGKCHSNETKRKLKEINLGKHCSEGTRKKMSKAAEGHRVSEKTRKKIGIANSKANKGQIPWIKGKHHSIKTRRKIGEALAGEKNTNWKGGISKENALIRRGIDFRLWREAVFARDNYTCQKSGQRGGKLHSHHIKNFADYPELRFAIDNGITLSKDCHQEFHNRYGQTGNTKKQLEEFLERGGEKA